MHAHPTHSTKKKEDPLVKGKCKNENKKKVTVCTVCSLQSAWPAWSVVCGLWSAVCTVCILGRLQFIVLLVN